MTDLVSGHQNMAWMWDGSVPLAMKGVCAGMGVIETLLQILGSLGLFIYGMKVMSDGIQKAAGEKLQKTLGLMTKNRVSALFTGLGVTTVIQSSSATTVMVVSFVSAGMLTLVQAVGVIMGANIGTTITGWIVAIFGFKMKIAAMALPAIGLGLPLLFIKKLKKENFGECLIGFGLLFLGLSYLKDSMPDIQSNPEILEMVKVFSGSGILSHLAFVVIGAVMTVVVQSSSATVAITQTMAFQGWIDFPSAAAIVLGENIGTTITAQLASIGTPLDARRAAMAHTIFNGVGVIWVTAVFPLLIRMVDSMIPGTLFGSTMDTTFTGGAAVFHSYLGPVTDGVTLATGIALFHTIFNVANTFVMIWFVPQFTYIVMKLVRGKREPVEDGVYRLKFMTASLQDAPEMNIAQARKEVQKMAGVVEDMFTRFSEIMHNRETDFEDDVKLFAKKEELTDQMQSEISRFLGECSRYNLSDNSASDVAALIRITDELESIADSCYRLILLAKKRSDKKYEYAKGVVDETRPYTDLVREFLALINKHLGSSMTQSELDRAAAMERRIDEYRNAFKKAARKRIEHGASVRGEILFIDKLQQMEHIGDFAFNIARALALMNHER